VLPQRARSDSGGRPPYAFSSPVGFRCGADRREVPDTTASVIDVLLDSLPADTVGMLGLNIDFASKEGRPGISASMDYTSGGRRAGTACMWSDGITFIVNARRAVAPTLNAVATGPVQVTIRDLQGHVLGGPIRLIPGNVQDSIGWRLHPGSGSRALNLPADLRMARVKCHAAARDAPSRRHLSGESHVSLRRRARARGRSLRHVPVWRRMPHPPSTMGRRAA
jgi:hypothetical protein